MIDGFKLTEDLITFEKGFDNWQDAIKSSSKGLLEGGYIKESYLQAMIDCVVDYGPYIVIAPNVAMPHARPETGSVKPGFSIMICKEPVVFSKEDDLTARLFVTLSCVSSDTHIKMIQALANILVDEAKLERLLHTDSKEAVLEIFK